MLKSQKVAIAHLAIGLDFKVTHYAVTMEKVDEVTGDLHELYVYHLSML